MPSSPLKVTMINAEWLPVPPVLGGPIEETLYQTAIAIQNPKFTVISPWVDALKESDSYPKDIFYHVDIESEKKHIKSILGNHHLSVLENDSNARYFSYLNGVTHLLKKLDPDIIQIHNRSDFIPYFLQEFPKKSLIAYMHNQPTGTGSLLAPKWIKLLDHLVFVSHALEHQYVKQYPESRHKTTVIYNSIDTDIWNPNCTKKNKIQEIRKKYDLKQERTVLFMGRLIYEKGISFLIEAIKLVRRSLPDVKLLIAGSPLFKAVSNNPFLRKLKQSVASLRDTVVFTGYIDHCQTPHLYAVADITVAPSLCAEGFGKVVAESMATGTPVIGSRMGAIPEIIDHKVNGILIDDPTDIKLLAQNIINILKSARTRNRMGIAARQKVVSHFSPSTRIANLETFYKNLEHR